MIDSIKMTEVYKVNGRLVVADNIEDACQLYKHYCNNEIREVVQIKGEVSFNDTDFTAITYSTGEGLR